MPNWNSVVEEITRKQVEGQRTAQAAIDTVRREYLKKLHKFTERNIIAYYSGWLSKPNIQSEIVDEDKNGFMTAIHGLDRTKGLDLSGPV